MTKNQTSTAKSATTTTSLCRCGCGESTSSSKTQYRPGHDARHVGIVARDIASSSEQYFERVTADEDLGSAKLVAKAHAMAERLLAKKQPQDRKAKSDKADKKAAATLVAQEEAAHAAAEAQKQAEREAQADQDWSVSEGVKVGRWVYPGRKLSDGTLVRNTKRDGSGEWVAV